MKWLTLVLSLRENSVIEVVGITKDYENDTTITHALRGVNFTIADGEFVAIMGPSGSGKSTLLQVLSFLERPTNGTYQFNHRAMSDLSDAQLAGIRNEEIGFIFQSFNLLGRSTVYDNVELPLMYSKKNPAERDALIRRAVDSVGLTDKLLVEAGKLSGGQKQRVAIARALVNDPKVVFADEPTGNLDSVSGAQVMEILSDLHEKGRTIILVTHETYTAEFAQRIIRVKDGVVESDELIKKRNGTRTKFFK